MFKLYNNICLVCQWKLTKFVPFLVDFNFGLTYNQGTKNYPAQEEKDHEKVNAFCHCWSYHLVLAAHRLRLSEYLPKGRQHQYLRFESHR